MKIRRPFPIALWLPTLAVGAALFLVFVWPTPYRYEAPLSPDGVETRTHRLTGRVEVRTRQYPQWHDDPFQSF